MKHLEGLRTEIFATAAWHRRNTNLLLAEGLRAHLDEPNVIARAYGIQCLFEHHEKHIYQNDLIAGSLRGLIANGDEDFETADRLVYSFGWRTFSTNSDHYAADYPRFLTEGIDGTLARIDAAMEKHKNGLAKQLQFLKAARITVEGFSRMITGYGEAAEKAGKPDVRDTCLAVSKRAPKTFREALQLLWLTQIAFCYEGRYAMAFGRMDQYLYPYYRDDLAAGRLTREEALELLCCTFFKILEARLFGGDDVQNIVIGGVKPEDGSDGVNELSYLILEAVGLCRIPGPNLSARIAKCTPDEFVKQCLRVIGTGLGYPALMNDEVNIPALQRHGYTLYDCRNYCMVGCIENFIQGKQPPWSDGRFNTPKYLELALNDGKCMLTGKQLGPHTGTPDALATMEAFMAAVEAQMTFGAALYMAEFRNENDRLNPENYMQPFLSVFCRDCIDRGLDINDGGAHYPSAHAPGLMGIATVSDSLAAVEQVVYQEQRVTLSELRDALQADFVGYEALQKTLLQAPKYGNGDPFVDKYAAWFVAFQEKLFSRYRTRDGGPIYIAIASNVSNIPAGLEIAATPDGRTAKSPLSDAASPMHGRDKRGPTAAFLSLSRPDYTLAACGTVVNQKYSPVMFTDPEKREKLCALVRTYFDLGGQELQINAVNREILQDAMEHPQEYESLVVRVSGFSAYYTSLSREVQEDILQRTEHE